MDSEIFNFDNLAQHAGDNPFGEQKQSFADDRFFKLTKNAEGAGSAIIRFLPDPEMKMMQQLYRINANNTQNGIKRFVSEWSPKNIGLPDPFQDKWAELWNAGRKDESKKFGRSSRFITNILVVKDPGNPANEGKVFLLDMSETLKRKLEGIMQPSKEELALGTQPKQLFNPLNGFNYKLVARKGANGFTNYDSSDTAPEPNALFEDKEKALAFIKENCYSLGDFLKPEAYKSFDELKQKLAYVQFLDVSDDAKGSDVEVVDASESASTASTATAEIKSEQNSDLDDFLNSI